MNVVKQFEIRNGNDLLPLGKDCTLSLYYMYCELKSLMNGNQQSNQPVVLAPTTHPSTSLVNTKTIAHNAFHKNNRKQSTRLIERASNALAPPAPPAPPAPRPTTDTCIICLENFSDMSLDEISIHMNAHLDQGAQKQSSSLVDAQQLVVIDKPNYRLDVGSHDHSPNNLLVDNQKYICDYCKNGFKHRIDLKGHMKLAHFPKKVKVKKAAVVDKSKQRRLPCSQCPKIFAKMSSYKRHLLIHAGTKFECTFCLKSLSSKDNLYRHIKGVH
jgi:hypothetical protein